MINNEILDITRKRLIRINIAVVGSFLIIFSLCIYSYFKSQTYKNVDLHLTEEFEYIKTQIYKNNLYFVSNLLDPKDIVYIYKNDKIKFFTPNGYFKEFIPYNNSVGLGFNTYKYNLYTFRELKFDMDGYKVQIIRNIDSERMLLNKLLIIFFIGTFLAIVITYFIALYLTKKALIPIEKTWNKQVEFIQDASHELRTPVTIISSKLESLLKKPTNFIGDEIETIAEAMKENRRLKKMVNDLLDLTKEEYLINLNIEKFNLYEFINDISNNYLEISEIYGKKFKFNLNCNDFFIESDKSKLRQLLIIFIDNAFKYTNEGDLINLNLEDTDNFYIISIKDTGIGINENELDLIFNRFFRSSVVRESGIEGSGIGLSIASMLVKNIKGKIKVKSKISEGTEFIITIPKKFKNN